MSTLTPFRQALLQNQTRQLRIFDKLAILSGGMIANFISIFVMVGVIELLYGIPTLLSKGNMGTAGFFLIHGAMFAGIPLVVILFGIKKRLKVIRLLERGLVTEAQVTQGEPTGLTVNGNQERYYTLTFEDADGNLIQARDKTLQHHAVQDEDKELILYSPFFPEDAVLVDGLSTSLRIDESSNHFQLSRWRYFSIMGPLIVIATILTAPLYWIYLLL